MLKTKRYQFGINIVIIALFAMAAAIALLSAYGASCVAWDPSMYEDIWIPMPPPDGTWMAHPAFGYIKETYPTFQIMNVLTYISAFTSAFVIYALMTKNSRTYWIGLGSAVLGFISGLVPALIAETKNFDPAETFGITTPHWGRTFVYLLVIIVMIIPSFKGKKPYLAVARSVKSFVARENTMTYGRQLITMSFFFFWLALVSFFGTTFLAEAHVIGGVNYWQFVDFQILSGVGLAITGGSMLSTGLIYNKMKASSSLITTLE